MQQRIKLSLKKDANDERYSISVIVTKIDTCNVGKGKLTTLVQKVFMATFSKSSNFTVTCPFLKNQPVIVSNLSITDKFLPPMRDEKKFKVHVQSYAKIQDKRGWTSIVNISWYGSYKK